MAKSIIAHPAQESTSKEKTGSCSDCGQRFPRRKLREVGSEEASWSLTVCEGQALCRSCARRHGLLVCAYQTPRCPLEANLARLL